MLTTTTDLDRARELYEELGSYAAVAREMNVTAETVRYALNDEARERRNAYRRKWRATKAGRESVKRDNARRVKGKQKSYHLATAVCEKCGNDRGPGSAWPSRNGYTGLCRRCIDEERHEAAQAKRRRVEQLWNEGKTGKEIAAELGMTTTALRQLIHKMRNEEDGWNVPRRYKTKEN